MLFFANADLRNAVAAGARTASIFPTPNDAVILEAVNDQVAGIRTQYLTAPTIAKSTDAAGNTWIEISMSYRPPLNLVFFEMPAVTLRETRRVFTAQTVPARRAAANEHRRRIDQQRRPRPGARSSSRPDAAHQHGRSDAAAAGHPAGNGVPAGAPRFDSCIQSL